MAVFGIWGPRRLRAVNLLAFVSAAPRWESGDERRSELLRRKGFRKHSSAPLTAPTKSGPPRHRCDSAHGNSQRGTTFPSPARSMWQSDRRTRRTDNILVDSRRTFSASTSLQSEPQLGLPRAAVNACHRLPRVTQAPRTSARHAPLGTALRKGTMSTFAPHSFALGAALMPQTASFHQAHRRQALTTREVLDSRAPLSVLCRYFCVTYIVRHHHKSKAGVCHA